MPGLPAGNYIKLDLQLFYHLVMVFQLAGYALCISQAEMSLLCFLSQFGEDQTICQWSGLGHTLTYCASSSWNTFIKHVQNNNITKERVRCASIYAHIIISIPYRFVSRLSFLSICCSTSASKLNYIFSL